MATDNSDFVNVQLSPFGVERAAGTMMQVHEGQHSFFFKAGEIQRVTRSFDWNRVLKNQHFNGHALFELVPDEEAEDVAKLQSLGIDATAGENEIDVKVPKVEVGA